MLFVEVNAHNGDGETPLACAIRRGNPFTESILKAAGGTT